VTHLMVSGLCKGRDSHACVECLQRNCMSYHVSCSGSACAPAPRHIQDDNVKFSASRPLSAEQPQCDPIRRPGIDIYQHHTNMECSLCHGSDHPMPYVHLCNLYSMYIHGFSLEVSLVLVPDLVGNRILSNWSKSVVGVLYCTSRALIVSHDMVASRCSNGPLT
jgi:hypothetical protein